MKNHSLTAGARRRVIAFFVLLTVYCAGTAGLTVWDRTVNASQNAEVIERTDAVPGAITASFR